MTFPLRPRRGGFVRPFGCGWFIREYLLGNAPYGSPVIDPQEGAPQADIFYAYKTALLQATASERAIRMEERQAHQEKRILSPTNIETLTASYLARLPFKSSFCRYHSFVVYFSNLQRLGWVEFTGREEVSAFQEHYQAGQPRRYYRLTATGRAASESAWRDPYRTLYG